MFNIDLKPEARPSFGNKGKNTSPTLATARLSDGLASVSVALAEMAAKSLGIKARFGALYCMDLHDL